MSLFDKIGDVLGDVVEGVFDFVDDVFNIDLAKVFSNDIVKYGLMAMSLFTGGVAIVNGVMKGFEAATTMAGDFMSKFVAGGTEFVKGVASGFMNPVETFKGMTGIGEAANAATSTGSAIGDAMADTGSAASDMLMEGGDIASTIGPEVGVDVAAGGIQETLGQAGGDFSLSGLNAMEAGDAAMSAGPSGSGATNPFLNTGDAAQAASGAPVSTGVPDVITNAGKIAEGVPDVITKAGQTGAGGAKAGGFWSNLGKSAQEWATSPGGMNTIVGAVSGYSQAAMQQRQWDEERELVRQRARSWSDNEWTPRTWNQTTLQGMKKQNDERDRINARGNQAQNRWGYTG